MEQKAKPTIVYIITKLELGGAQKVCLSLFHDLKHHDIRTILITGSEGVLVKEIIYFDDAILLPTMKREISLQGISNELKNFLTIIRTLRKLKKEHPNILVHTHSTKAGLLGRWAAFFAGIKTRIHTVHGFGFHPHQAWIPWLITYFFELITTLVTTQFICVSQADKQTGAHLFPAFAHRTQIIRAAVDEHKFIPANLTTISKNLFIFGTVACFKPQKNLFDLLEAFYTVYQKHPDTRLELIGDGALRITIEEWIKQRNLQNSILLHGWSDQVHIIMQNWNAFCLSSLWEGLPCSIIEARLMRLPVITYNTGGIPEIIQTGKNGFVIDQKDREMLTQVMTQLVEKPDLCTQLSKYPDNLSDFSRNIMIKQHRQLYQKYLS